MTGKREGCITGITGITGTTARGRGASLAAALVIPPRNDHGSYEAFVVVVHLQDHTSPW